MTKQKSKDAPSWVAGYKNRQRAKPQYGKRRVLRAEYSLGGLVEEGHLSQEALDDFQRATGLGDMTWRLLWVADGPEPDDEQLQARVAEARGVVVFIHGWDGSGEIWEDLPGLVLSDDPAMVALVPDVNGFGGTPFVREAPAYDQCSPPAAMHAIERWINLLDLRSPRDFPNPRVFTFVGHSMGGAALFFLEDDNWSGLEVARVGAAPALLLRDNLRQGFYRALGAGIMLSRWSTFMDWLQERYLAPRMIEALVGWASDFVKEEHRRIYERTPEAVISRTFTAMGRLEATFDKDRWRHFLVFLAHRDRLVGLMESLELLEELTFEPHQLRVCLGDHYFFSVGKAQPRLHALNREMLKDEVLALH
jgi:pimeloyl-ACP methyl ester carboxylesterase